MVQLLCNLLGIKLRIYQTIACWTHLRMNGYFFGRVIFRRGRTWSSAWSCLLKHYVKSTFSISFWSITQNVLLSMDSDEDPACRPVHLLWTLMFLKIYSTECVDAGIVNANEKSFRKWVWFLVKEVSKLEFVSSFCFIFQIWKFK